jgi:acid phosphatase type 7
MTNRRLVTRLSAASALVLSTMLTPVGLRTAAAAGDPVVVAAGDIATCNSGNDSATAALVEGIPGTVLTLGDNAYPDGSAGDYARCYGPTWGRPAIKSRTRPSPGNHEYNTKGASGYYHYFGAAAGDPGKGWYSFDLGAWHLVSLNSECISGCGPGSPMERWLKADLAASPHRCILAYWHRPRFFSPAIEPGASHLEKVDTRMSTIWSDLQAGGADVVLAGHRHVYERFPRQDSSGRLDPRGMREFIVGTGGALHESFRGKPAAHSEIRKEQTFGVIRLSLHAGGYDWRFIPTSGGFTDSGSDTCG